MNFSFEGNYKPKRNINLGGARSHEDKKALLAKAQAERRAREHQRLRFRSAVKIQAFYRGRREAISVRCRVRQTLSEELNALGRPEHPVMTFSTSDRDQIVSCMRYCLLLVQGPMHDVSGLVRQLCDFLLSRPAQSDLLRFMHLFYDCGNNSEMIDEMTWLSALFTTRVILPILETSVRDEQTLLRFLSLVINPTTYNRIQRPNFVPHTTFMRIFTHIYFYGHLMNTLRQQLLRETLPNEAFHIVLSVIRCQPPYDFPPSEISRWKPSREVPTFPSMFGLFSGNVSSASSVEGTVTTAAQSETRLTRETILRDLLTQVFSIPFLADRIPKDWLVLFMSEMPFSAALETLLRLHETRRLSEDHTPQQVVGLLMNITQLGNMEAGMHMDGGFVSVELVSRERGREKPATRRRMCYRWASD
ncbi:hypothetical protein BX666DRAFT_818263 [Dichotomocladium elegans]|nr:hypothetical protein BX666DRAFT_818263 [Dichotomocladium elegans]